MKNLILLFLGLALITFSSRASWRSGGNFESLLVSDTTIKQYLISPDGKSLFVMDNKFSLSKYNAATGNLVWKRDASIHDSANYTFIMAKISPNADVFAIISYDPSKYLIQVRSIENGARLYSWVIDRSASLNFNDFSFSGKNLILSEGVYSFSNGGWYTSFHAGGLSRFYKIEKDSLKYQRTLSDFFLKLYDFDLPSANMLGYYYYMNYYWDGKNSSVDVAGHYLVNYDIANDSINKIYFIQTQGLYGYYAHHYMFNNIHVSKDGRLAFLRTDNSVILVDLGLCKDVLTINYRDTVISSTSSYDKEYLLLSDMDTIKVLSARNLSPIDTLTFPGLAGTIDGLSYSPDGSKVYFKNGRDICRFTPGFKTADLKAFFYPDTNNIHAGQAIHFFNGSSGYPEAYSWDFGDGKFSNEKDPVHVYSDTGHFDVKLVAYKGSDSSSFIIKNAVYVQPFMKSSFTFKKYEDDCPVRVEFTNKSQGVIDSVYWDFGDGFRSKELNPVHYYYFTGTYKVFLRIFSEKLTKDTTVTFDVLFPYFPVDKSKFRYEYSYPYDRISEALQGYETQDGQIVFNKLADTVSSIISTDNHNSVSWENNRMIRNIGILRKPLKSNELLFGYYQSMVKMNGNGDTIMSASLKRPINNFNFDKSNLYYGSIYFYQPEYRFCISDIDAKLEESQKDSLLGTCHFPDPVRQSDEIIHADMQNHDGILDFILRYWYKVRVEDSMSGHYWHWEYGAGVTINNHFFSKDLSLDFYDAQRLNKNKLIVLFNDSTLYAFNSDSTYSWYRDFSGSASFNNLLRLSDSAFVISGNINGQPGYIIYNENGDILDSASVSCRYGSFNHVSVTPDTNLLFSGYIYKNVKKDKQAYFVKTGSDKIKSYLPSLFSGGSGSDVDDITFRGELNIAPNPTTGEVIINGGAIRSGHLKIDVLDIYGALVSTIYNGDYRGGDIKFNLSGVADGMYFVKIENEGGLSVSKVVKLR